MKILAFSDIQGDEALLDSLIKSAKRENVDYLVCAGDLSDWNQDLKNLILRLRKTGRPLIIVPGNHDDCDELKILAEKFKDFLIDINKKSYFVNRYCFLGYGEGVFEVIDEDFEKMVEDFLKKKRKYDKLILVTHAPPYGTELDNMPLVGHVGNKSYKKAINKLKPDLFICGHIHETEGKIDKIGKTILINPGPIGRVIEI
jgi:hypothetical protein